jgi:hypothetical protein
MPQPLYPGTKQEAVWGHRTNPGHFEEKKNVPSAHLISNHDWFVGKIGT